MVEYYIPGVEEFHMGFEYERLEPVLIDKGWHKIYAKQWVPKIADRRYIMNYFGAWEFVRDIEDGLIRVKYLNREDLKEIGFTKIHEIKGNQDIPYSKFKTFSTKFGLAKKGNKTYNGNLRSYGATIYFDNIVDSTFIRIDGEISPGAVYGHMGSAMFRGYIKNKSELKKLLKQLNIE